MLARPVCFLILAVLIQLGMVHRVVASGACCPETAGMHCDDHADAHHHPHGHDHPDDTTDHPASEDAADADGKPACPDEDCGHHHHHGTCVHSIPLSVFGVGDCRLPRLTGVTLERLNGNQRVPDGPVMEREIPPLI